MKIRRFLLGFLSMSIVLIGSSCSKNTLTNEIKHHIIIDTDTAGDDAYAMMVLAKASNIEIEGVTVLAGNVTVEQSAKNALMTLEVAGKGNIGVYKGAETALDGIERECFSVFGTDGMGDMDLIHPTGKAQEQNAVDFILETIKKYPNEIELLALGPATNIAMAIEKDPETMKLVKEIWSMGTAGFGTGNATPVAEFNVYNDALAYKVMLESGIKTTIVGRDICELDSVLYYPKDMEKLAKVSTEGDFIVKSWTKLHEFKKNNQNSDFVDVCDGTAALCLLFDNLVTSKVTCSAYVCVEEGPTFGQVIFYEKDYTYDSMPTVTNYNKDVVTKINDKEFKDAALKLFK